MEERLQKIVAAAGLASRRKAEEWIKAGRVTVDGVVVKELGCTADSRVNRIEVDGHPIQRKPKKRVYVALNKPKGFASTLADPHASRFITELIDLPGKPMLRTVGRLDIESEGLIFLSDDGAFIYRLTHPKFQVEKVYTATVRGAPDNDQVARLRTGVRLDDGSRAKADRVRLTGVFPKNDTADLELVVHEGRNRLIRRLCSAIGHPVLRLVRTRIAFITLGGLPQGAWRHLTPAEVERLMEGKQDTTPTQTLPKKRRRTAASSSA